MLQTVHRRIIARPVFDGFLPLGLGRAQLGWLRVWKPIGVHPVHPVRDEDDQDDDDDDGDDDDDDDDESLCLFRLFQTSFSHAGPTWPFTMRCNQWKPQQGFSPMPTLAALTSRLRPRFGPFGRSWEDWKNEPCTTRFWSGNVFRRCLDRAWKMYWFSRVLGPSFTKITNCNNLQYSFWI